MIEIKKLGIENKAKIIAFDKLCFPTDFWETEDWEDLLNDNRAIYYALMVEDEIIGNVFIYNWKGEKDYIKIMNLAVRSDYRGKGLAHRLLNYAASEMGQIDMRKFCGETRASNKAMQKVFEDCGYFLDKIEENYYDNPNESAYKYVLQK